MSRFPREAGYIGVDWKGVDLRNERNFKLKQLIAALNRGEDWRPIAAMVNT